MVCQSLLQYGFQASKCDPSMFMFHTNILYIMVLVYVDHIIIIENPSSFIDNLIKNLNDTLTLKQLGNIDYFLGIEVTHLPNGFLLLS